MKIGSWDFSIDYGYLRILENVVQFKLPSGIASLEALRTIQTRTCTSPLQSYLIAENASATLHLLYALEVQRILMPW